jgi:hypothetical protein
MILDYPFWMANYVRTNTRTPEPPGPSTFTFLQTPQKTQIKDSYATKIEFDRPQDLSQTRLTPTLFSFYPKLLA